MGHNRILTIAIITIVIGLIGFIGSSLLSSYQGFAVVPSAAGMMMDGCMMDRGHMNHMMQRMMPGMLPPGIKQENLPDQDSRGAKLLTHYCDQCHNLPSPGMHTAEEWPSVAGRMFARMSMMSGMGGMMTIENPSGGEKQTILSYLKTHSLKAIAPGALPAPESRGAVQFKEICSQCHSLPDPKIHVSKDWPAVVRRMENNMQAMGKKVVTEEEKKEITGYLMSQAHK
jgi:cytochrome c5